MSGTMHLLPQPHAQASLETEMLLCSANVNLDAGGTERLRALACARPDWERLLQMALAHRTMPLVYKHLSTACPDVVPAPFMARLHDHFYLNAMRNEALKEELCGLLRLLALRDIAAVPYKGPVLALCAYGDLSLRQFNDLDVMVRPQDVRRAAPLLRERGYEQQWHLSPAQEAAYLRSDCEMLFARDQGGLFVDLHWALVRRCFSVRTDYERLWRRLQPVSLGGCQAQTFAPEDLLTILCVHAGKDLWERLIWVADVAQLLATHADLDWTRIFKEATASGARRMLLLGLFLAHDLLGAKLPAEVLRQVEAEPAVKALAARVRRRLSENGSASRSPLAEFLFHFRLHEGLRAKCSFAFRFATTTNPADWAAVRLPDPLFFLYYFLRPLRLLIRRR